MDCERLVWRTLGQTYDQQYTSLSWYYSYESIFILVKVITVRTLFVMNKIWTNLVCLPYKWRLLFKLYLIPIVVGIICRNILRSFICVQIKVRIISNPVYIRSVFLWEIDLICQKRWNKICYFCELKLVLANVHCFIIPSCYFKVIT